MGSAGFNDTHQGEGVPTRETVAAHPVSGLTGVIWPAVPRYQEACIVALAEQFRETERWPWPKIENYQLMQLDRLLEHHRATTPLVRERLRKRKIPTDGSTAMDTFRELSVFRQHDFHEAGEALFSTAPPADHGTAVARDVSGLDGGHLAVRHTEIGVLIRHALRNRDHFRHGRDPSAKVVQILGPGDIGEAASDDHASGWLPGFQSGPLVPLDGARMTPEEQFDWLCGEQPAYVLGSPSSLVDLASVSDRRGLAWPWLKGVVCSGRAPAPGHIETIERIWGIALMGTYGSAEVGPIADQCPVHGSYHINAENLIVEIVDEAGAACAPGQIGRVVVTDLHNFATALIRYDTGDSAALGEPCACNRTLPVLCRICPTNAG